MGAPAPNTGTAVRKMEDQVDRLFQPLSILALGSSRQVGGMATPAAFEQVASNLERYGRGRLTVLEVEVFPERLPEAELAVILLPPTQALAWARRAVEEAGCKGLVLLNGGFSTLQRIQLRELVARHRVALLGPNSILGLVDTTTGLDTSFERDFFPGPGGVALVCQSGGVGAMLMDLARERAVGLSKVIFPGDKVGLSDADLMAHLAADDRTRAVALYVEGLADGPRFRRVVARMTRDKPLVALKGGASEAAAARARSHTASLAGNARLFASAIRTAGGLMVETPEQLLLVAEGLGRLPRPRGNQLALISNVGGPAILLADALSAAGYHLPRLAGAPWSGVRKEFPMVETINPVDLIADADGPRYAACLRAALADPHVHVVVLVVQFRSTYLRLEDLDTMVQAVADLPEARAGTFSSTQPLADPTFPMSRDPPAAPTSEELPASSAVTGVPQGPPAAGPAPACPPTSKPPPLPASKAAPTAKPIVAVCPGSPLRDQVAARLPWPVYASPGEAVTVLAKLREWSRRRVQAQLEED